MRGRPYFALRMGWQDLGPSNIIRGEAMGKEIRYLGGEGQWDESSEILHDDRLN